MKTQILIIFFLWSSTSFAADFVDKMNSLVSGDSNKIINIDFKKCTTRDGDITASMLQKKPVFTEVAADSSGYKIRCEVTDKVYGSKEKIYQCTRDPHDGSPVKKVEVFWMQGYRAPYFVQTKSDESAWFVKCDLSTKRCDATEILYTYMGKTATEVGSAYKNIVHLNCEGSY